MTHPGAASPFQRATRRAVKLKLAIQGPSGSGKTLGALALAHGLAQGGSVALVDTENGSASLYADRYQYDALEIHAPYLTSKYEAAVKAALAGGYRALVIDSISHQWDGDGGILQRKEDTDARGGNHFSNWAPFTKEHNQLRALILHSPIHIVATMRSKMAYAQEGDGKKTTIKKLGLQPIQREGMEYEFTVAFDVQMDHKATASKDRTSLFTVGLVDLLDPAVPQRLLQWLESAPEAEVATAPAATAAAATVDADGIQMVVAPQPQKLLCFSEAKKAGLTKDTFAAWYTEVVGRPFIDIYETDLQPLLAAATARIARKRADPVTAP